jgi:hypothetical protein
MSNHGVLCLHAGPAGRLFVCENPFTIGAPAIAASTDEGRTVTPLAAFSDIQGPVACGKGPSAPDGAAGLCDAAWPETAAQFLPREAGAAPPDGGVRRRRDGGAGDAAAEPAAPPVRKSCSCGVLGASPSPDRAWLTAGLIPLVLGGIARRRRGSPGVQSGPSRTR